MVEFLISIYPWVKTLHIISAMSWMAGLLYLPRLYVYHAMVERDSARDLTFQLMERRLLKAIMNPAMIASFIFIFIRTLLDPKRKVIATESFAIAARLRSLLSLKHLS